MATWHDVRRIAVALPEATESGPGTFERLVRDRSPVWQRPLRPADLMALGADAPTGPVLGARPPDLHAKASLLDGSRDIEDGERG